MAAATCLFLLGGCDQLFNIDHINYAPDQPVPDAEIPVLIDAQAACSDGTFVGQSGANNAGLMHVCVPSTVTTDVTMSGTINTESDCDFTVGVDVFVTVCVKWARTMTVSGLRTRGARPLALVATGTITIGGDVDVASHYNGNTAGGANPGVCPAPDGANNTNGGGGGAGGSFGTQGGDGGPNAHGDHAQARAVEPGDRVRGGCSGGLGGTGGYAGNGGAGGQGGGGVYFAAGQAITIGADAIINASGAGGSGGNYTGTAYSVGGGGGGGGGAGGLIGLDAPTIEIASGAKLFANGGGGGAGGTTLAGAHGSDPTSTAINTMAPGGAGSTATGGAGAVGTGRGVTGGTGKSSGGGGGGVGYIRIFSTGLVDGGGKFSPPHT